MTVKSKHRIDNEILVKEKKAKVGNYEYFDEVGNVNPNRVSILGRGSQADYPR